MNNKYDVKNFSDLIDQFNIDEEMKMISDHIRDINIETQNEKELNIETDKSRFDPVIDKADKTKSAYKLSKYHGTRYDLDQL